MSDGSTRSSATTQLAGQHRRVARPGQQGQQNAGAGQVGHSSAEPVHHVESIGNSQHTMTVHCTMYIRRQVSSRAASRLTAPTQRAWRSARRSVVENMSRSSVPASRSIKVDDYLAATCLLPNLQLLGGAANIETDGLPAGGWTPPSPSENKRATYLAEDDLDGLPLDRPTSPRSSEQRKQRVRSACSPLWERHREHRRTPLSRSPRSRGEPVTARTQPGG